MARIPDWLGSEMEVAVSSGGVLAAVDPWRNVVRGGVTPWPPPELVQKLYQSRHSKAYRDEHLEAATRGLGFYSDLQSVHSEDALTWSVFGTVAHAAPEIKLGFVRSLLGLIHVPMEPTHNVHIWLWRRIPHPEALVSGGPEVGFGIQTDTLWLLGEAKWLSDVASAQGVSKNKTQLALRHEFCEKYGRRLPPGCRQFVVLGVSRAGGMLTPLDSEAEEVSIHARDTIRRDVVGLESHPNSAELRRHLDWKERNSRST